MNNTAFYIDSGHLDNVESGLYGYMIQDDGEITMDQAHVTENRTGCFVYVKAEGNLITIKQDFFGSFGLFVYREDGYFALSNSLYLLTNQLRGRRLSIDRQAVDALLFPKDGIPLSFSRTIIGEIQRLDSQDEVVISVRDRTLKIVRNPFPYFQISPESEEGLRLLDTWYTKWVWILRKIIEKGEHPLYADLSGGYDTRILLSMLVNAKVDLNTVCFRSHKRANLPKDADDYRIATQIAHVHGFKLNEDANHKQSGMRLRAEDVYSHALYHSLGNTLLVKYGYSRYSSPVLELKGLGSSIKGNQVKDLILGGIKEYDSWNGTSLFQKIGSERKEYIRYMNEQMAEVTDLAKQDEMNRALAFQKATCEKRDGHKMVDWLWCNRLVITPFEDLEITRLDCTAKKDKHFLPLLILDRYCPELLSFELQGRTIQNGTLNQVREINRLHPVSLQFPSQLIQQREFTLESQQISAIEFSGFLENIWNSQEFERAVAPYVSKRILKKNRQITDGAAMNNGPKMMNALLAIYEIRKLLQ